jgi:hypothetical protein
MSGDATVNWVLEVNAEDGHVNVTDILDSALPIWPNFDNDGIYNNVGFAYSDGFGYSPHELADAAKNLPIVESGGVQRREHPRAARAGRIQLLVDKVMRAD